MKFKRSMTSINHLLETVSKEKKLETLSYIEQKILDKYSVSEN